MPVERINDGSYLDSQHGVVSHQENSYITQDSKPSLRASDQDLTPNPPENHPFHTPITGSLFEKFGNWASAKVDNTKEAASNFPEKRVIQPETTEAAPPTENTTSLNDKPTTSTSTASSDIDLNKTASIQSPYADLSSQKVDEKHSILGTIGDWLTYKNRDYTYHYHSDNTPSSSSGKSDEKAQPRKLEQPPAHDILTPTAEEKGVEAEQQARDNSGLLPFGRTNETSGSETSINNNTSAASPSYQQQQQPIEGAHHNESAINKLGDWVSTKLHLGQHQNTSSGTVATGTPSAPRNDDQSFNSWSLFKVKPTLDENPDAKPKYNANSPEHTDEPTAPKTLDNKQPIEKANEKGESLHPSAKKFEGDHSYDSVIL